MTSQARIEATSIGQLPGWRVRTPHGSALVTQQGAQLLSYAPAGGRPLIWLSEQAHLLAGVPVRGGIPVCWPWFAAYERNPPAVRDSVGAPPGAPSHGWVRQADWRLTGQHAQAGTAELEFEFNAPPGSAPGWRHPAQLSLRMRFGQDIALVLSIRNLGTEAITTALALHTYLAVSDSRRVEIHGLQGCDYLDMAGHWERRRQSGPVRLDGETDRLYLETAAPVVVHDPGWRRKVRLHATGSHSTVVWNPGPRKAERLNDFANDGWQGMVCVETTRTLDDTLIVAPGETGAVSLSISELACPA